MTEAHLVKVSTRRTLALALLFVARASAEDARAIVERSIQAMDRTTRLAEQYTYRQLVVERDDGKVATRLYEVLTLGGKRHRHLVEKDGAALPAKEEKKQQEALNKAVAEANKLTPEQRRARAAERERRNGEERERLKYIPEAYDFRLLGETRLNGRGVYEIEALPLPHYRGKHDKLLRNMRGKLFIDKADYQWVRLEAESLDTISFGLVLARLSKGARITVEVTKINEEVWLPKRVTVDASARVGLLKKVRADVDVTYSDYRKFQADSRITSISEAEAK